MCVYIYYFRFLDRDGDGFITLDDISTVQALMMQRSHHFVKMIFRLYSEVLWYPGRQLNIMNMLNTNNSQANTTPVAPEPQSTATPPPTPVNKFSSIFSGLKKKEKEEETRVDYKYVTAVYTYIYTHIYIYLYCFFRLYNNRSQLFFIL